MVDRVDKLKSGGFIGVGRGKADFDSINFVFVDWGCFAGSVDELNGELFGSGDIWDVGMRPKILDFFLNPTRYHVVKVINFL